MQLISLRETIETLVYDEAQWVDARELWHWIGCPNGRFSNWVRDYILKSEYFSRGEDWDLVARANPDKSGDSTALKIEHGENGKFTPKNYRISLEFAKHLAMLARTAEGRVIRQYFIDTEKKYLSILKAIRDISKFMYQHSPDSWQLIRAYALVLGISPFDVKSSLMEAGWDGEGALYQELIHQGHALELRDALNALTPDE